MSRKVKYEIWFWIAVLVAISGMVSGDNLMMWAGVILVLMTEMETSR